MANGFSLYNRGQNLKKSLINPERVKEYLGKMEKENSDDAAPQSKNEMQIVSFNNQMETYPVNMPAIPGPLSKASKQKNLGFLQDSNLDEDKQWRLMMDYFKENPTALMDAIPTPPGEEEDNSMLKDFRTGLTPKRKFNFKFDRGARRGSTTDSLNNSFSAFANNRPGTG